MRPGLLLSEELNEVARGQDLNVSGSVLAC